MDRLLLCVLATAATLLTAACDDRECEFYNDCGSGAFCTEEGRCLPLAPSEGGSAGVSAMPASFVQTSAGPTPVTNGESSLGGTFGPRRDVPDGPAQTFLEQDAWGAAVWLDRWEEDGALLRLDTAQPLGDLLPAPGETVVLDGDDPTTQVAICWEEADAFDVHADWVQIMAISMGDFVVYDVSAAAYGAERADVSGRFALAGEATTNGAGPSD